MIVFFYDKTFEGFLTAVFDAYSRKTFPDKLLGEGSIAPMFMEESYTVITLEDRSARVWASLQKKLSKTACNMLNYVWLSEEEDSDDLLFRYIRKVFENAHSIEMNFGDDDVLQIHQLAKKVAKEELYLKQFIRFQKAADGIYFAPVSPVYNALPLAISHLKDRFSDQRWVVYDLKRKYGYYYDLKTVIEITLTDDEHLLTGKLNDALMAEEPTSTRTQEPCPASQASTTGYLYQSLRLQHAYCNWPY